MAKDEFWAMDTLVTVKIYGAVREDEAILARCREIVLEVEAALSATRPESDISRINRERSAGSLSPHTTAVLEQALAISRLTDGAYLPTMGALSALWRAAGEQNCLPEPEALEHALAEAKKGFLLEDGVCTVLGEGALLDLGGVGKGYAMDLLMDYLATCAATGALVSFGSSVAALGCKNERGEGFLVSLRDPQDRTGSLGSFHGFSGQLSVSGDYERYVTVEDTRYHHILDPESGYPTASGLSSVAVLAPSGAAADALSTAFMVLGREKSLALLGSALTNVEAVLVGSDGSLYKTAGLSRFY